MMYVVLRSSGLYRAAFFIIHLIAKNQMKQTIEVAGTYVPASVKAGMIFSWHTVAKVLNALPLGICECKICVNEFYAYLCNATITYRRSKRAGQERIESIGSSIITRSYTSRICGCSKLGLCGTAFFIHSSKCYNQMKQVIETARVTTPVPVKVGTIFSWHTAARVLNALPLGICECKTIEDAKGYVKALTIILSMFLLAAIEKGGTL